MVAQKPQSPTPIVSTQGLTKFFGHQPVLKGLNLSVAPGDILVILGPNGAGKTTLLKILATILRPTSGEVFINGFNARKEASKIRQGLGIVSHTPLLYGELTVYENLDFYARLWRLRDSQNRIKEMTLKLGVSHLAGRRTNTLSRGQQQRLSLARALLPEPSLLLLDEPDASLDPEGIAAMEKMVKEPGRTTIMATHNLELGLRLCSRIVIMLSGRIVHQQEKGNTDLERLRQTFQATTKAKNEALV